MMNLFEGNIMSGIQFDDYHGGSGYNTLFRNWIHGMDNAFGIPLTNNVKCIDMCRFSYSNNIVGNVLGSPSVAAVPNSAYLAPTNADANVHYNYMYRLGYPDMGNDCHNDNDVAIFYQVYVQGVFGFPITFDSRVMDTLFRINNYDYVTRGVPDGTATLPPSLVYGTKAPAWWPTTTNAPPWPPIGPDLSQMTGLIPAQMRFYNSTNTSGGTNGSTNAYNPVPIPAPTALRVVPVFVSGGYSPAADGNVFEWLKADAITGVASGNGISSWSASTGENLSTYGGSQNPTWNSNVKNGLPAVTFASASMQEAFTSSAFSSQSQPVTIFVVSKTVDAPTGFECMMGSYGAGTQYEVVDNSGPGVLYAGGAYSTAFTFDNNWHITMLVLNGSSSKYRVDNGSDTVIKGNIGNNAVNSLEIGRSSLHTDYWGGQVGEVVFCSGDQSANEAAIFGYLNGRWGAY